MSDLNSQFYHPGEAQLQQAVGSRDRTEEMSRVLMKDHMIQQHRDFFAGLEYLFVSAVDASDALRAVMVSGELGFLSTPSETILRLHANNSDVLAQLVDLEPGAMIGVVGLDMSSRRRNRMHGKVETVQSSHIDIRVTQSYGNCPKYINTRELTSNFVSNGSPISENRSGLIEADRAAIRAADVFFIASYFDDGKHKPFNGADMSHRGGMPGFVHVNGNTLTIPDFFGNNLFNTFGNLLLNPVTALLFVDFETGETRHLTGTAELITDPIHLSQYPEASRLLQVTVAGVKATTNATPLRWTLRELSPYNPKSTS